MKIKKYGLGVFAAFLVAISIGVIYEVKVLAQNRNTKHEPITCSDKLRQAMDDMHMSMHMVETSGDVDEDFVRLMLPHHQAAIDMAKIELLCGKDNVNRRLAQEIIADQQSEIDLMNLWLSKRSPSKASSSKRHHTLEEK